MRVVYTFLLTLGVQLAAAQGFFLSSWKPLPVPGAAGLDSFAAGSGGAGKTAAKESSPAAPSAFGSVVDVTVFPSDTLCRVSPFLFGNNANQWLGPVVDLPVLLDEIKRLGPGVIRYPGGNASNEFFWNGVVPGDAPDTLIMAAGARRERYFTGKWGLPVDSYYKMLAATGSTGIICVNMAYARYGLSADPVAAAAHLAAEWVRHDRGRTRFWELGNEDYGFWQAGYRVDSARLGRPALISGDIYGREARVFIDSMRAAAVSDIRIGVVLVETPPGAYTTAVERVWNEGVLRQAGDVCDFYIVHSYYTPYKRNSSAAEVLRSAVPVTDRMMDYMRSLGDKPVALTEYNIFAEGSRQQVSYIAGVHAVLVLGEAATRGFGLACRWDLANAYAQGNDHGLFNKGDEPGAALWKPRPAYYYLYYMRRCLGDHIVRSTVAGDSSVVVFASAFTGESRGLGVVIVNTGTEPHVVRVDAPGFANGYYYSLTGGAPGDGEFSPGVDVRLGRGAIESPPRSVQYVILQP
ncbi:MAG TPA: hypothetical protein VL547_21875 [Dinghuibacter sp.]|uniref:alpha-L-arabinofuranosidase n=1 Tax=Dinghuibacter sp. TaxID=2024697 RepID=UPI002B9632D5|nr:alpha-L-arabinofuranosidase [Dinghuibacter sp.]HTJ14710.1 hypothetical protein [Dinghuibacter sp.]